MSTSNIRSDVHRMIDELDEPFLKAVHAMLQTYTQEQADPIIGYELDGTPIHASVAKAQFKAELERVKQGEFVTIEDLEKEADQW